MTAQDWIDRYVAEVGRMLPARNPADGEKETNSLLHDAVEAEAGGADPVAAQTLAVLRQFGSPREMAMRYGASQYLIGPLLYPTFIRVLRVLAIAVNLTGIAVAALMLAGPSLAAWSELNLAFDIVVAIVLVVNAVEAAQHAWRLLKGRV